MKANTENRDPSFSSRAKSGKANRAESETQLRSRLLTMILESEHHRKGRFFTAPHPPPTRPM